MKHLALLAILAISLSAVAAEPLPPPPPGQYMFQHKHAEHPNLKSIALKAKISGRRITLINEGKSSVFPKGVIPMVCLYDIHSPSNGLLAIAKRVGAQRKLAAVAMALRLWIS